MRLFRPLRFIPLLFLLTPLFVSAQVNAVSQVVGIFNIFVGLMLTAALLLYGFGVTMWVIRLGTWPSYRTEAVRVLEWSVAVLFVLVVLLMIVQFFQKHPAAASYVLSAVVVLAVIGLIIYFIAHSAGGEKKEGAEKKPAH